MDEPLEQESSIDTTASANPVLLNATDELVAYSYHLLDQCVTLCDAAEEVKQKLLGTVYPHLNSEDESRADDDELADLVTAWKAEVANVGCDLVHLTADIRYLVSQTEDQQGQQCKDITNDQCNVPRSFQPTEMNSIRSVLSKLCAKTSEGLQDHLQRIERYTDLMNPPCQVARHPTTMGSGTFQPCGETESEHHLAHHQQTSPRGQRMAVDTRPFGTTAELEETTAILERNGLLSVGGHPTGEHTRYPMERNIVPIPPRLPPPSSSYIRHTSSSPSRRLQLRAGKADDKSRPEMKILTNRKFTKASKPPRPPSNSNESCEDMTSYHQHREPITKPIGGHDNEYAECRPEGASRLTGRGWGGDDEPKPKSPSKPAVFNEQARSSQLRRSRTTIFCKSPYLSDLLHRPQPVTPASTPTRACGELQPNASAPVSPLQTPSGANGRHGEGAI